MADSPKASGDRKAQPQQHPYERRQKGKRGEKDREDRAVEKNIVMLCRIGRIERLMSGEMIERGAEYGIVIVPVRSSFRNGRYDGSYPPQYRNAVLERKPWF
ncbi:hypothetical protein HMPREF1553_00718 [Porphyromonas gingivalis F0568]|nr:hypothetical protein HMPREF1553_00718 [Porphyromonas gingivalis F0568]